MEGWDIIDDGYNADDIPRVKSNRPQSTPMCFIYSRYHNNREPIHTVEGTSSLIGADLSYLDLSDADFRGRNVEGTNFTGSNLAGADFTGAIANHANFTHANMGDSFLTDANFRGAILDRTILCRADLTDTDFDGVDLTLVHSFKGFTGKSLYVDRVVFNDDLEVIFLEGLIIVNGYRCAPNGWKVATLPELQAAMTAAGAVNFWMWKDSILAIYQEWYGTDEEEEYVPMHHPV